MARLTRKPKLDKGLLKQSVLKENKKLQNAQKALSRDISGREDYLAAINKAVKLREKELSSTKEELEAYTAELKDLLVEKSGVTNVVKSMKSKVSALSSEEQKLSASSLKLEKKIFKQEKQNNQLKGLAKSIKQANDVLKNIDTDKAACIKELDKLKKSTSRLKGSYDKQDNERKALHEQMCSQMDLEAKKYAEEGYEMRKQAKELAKQLKADIRENNTKIGDLATAYRAAEKQSEDDLMDRRGQLAALKTEINRHGTALSKALIKLNDMKVKVDLEEKKLESAKRAFEHFKVKAFEQVATLKLRKKINKIDKAGLADIFNR